MSPLLSLAAALALLGLWLGTRLYNESGARSRSRASYLDAVKPLFENGEFRIQPTGFPRMSGVRNGLSFDLQAIPDSLTFRKLPALWVMVTLTEPLPVRSTLDILARPSGNEPFTHFATLPQTLPNPSGLPAHVAIRTDDATQLPPPDLIAGQAALFDDPTIKELVLSPRGLRIVFLAEEADRGRYLIFRDAEMGGSPLDARRVEPLLDRLAALRDALQATTEDSR